MIEDEYGDYETVKPNYAGINQSPVEERMIINRGRRGGTGKRNGRQGRSGKGKGRGKRRSLRTGKIQPRGRILASPYRRGAEYDNSNVDSLEEYFEDSPEVLGIQTGNTIVKLSPDKPVSRSMPREGSRSLSNDQYWSNEEFEETEINSESRNNANDLEIEGSADLISNEDLTTDDLAEVYDNEEADEDSSFHDDYVVTDNDFNDLDTNRFPGKVGKAKSRNGKIGKVNRGKGKGKQGNRKAAKLGRAKAKAKLRVLGKAKFGFGKM
ncbi:uncharacterized protein LOC111712604 [Eurytemora carolleeae]|uniref:uncharacterized protein LOC111712604 n=1 Tax=Eurytemora carolleeae TaxID=1294199 RepID=UPI000C788410|nr:uncharacterized protein LOC111712604 [Eurytemora carolleeae]|eukprot:XP_023343027.1 uncharacterized protein LOC111712604 [Eurytemora affinis]